MNYQSEQQLADVAKRALLWLNVSMTGFLLSFCGLVASIILVQNLDDYKLLLVLLLMLVLFFACAFYFALRNADKTPIYHWLRREGIRKKQVRGVELSDKEVEEYAKLTKIIKGKILSWTCFHKSRRHFDVSFFLWFSYCWI